MRADPSVLQRVSDAERAGYSAIQHETSPLYARIKEQLKKRSSRGQRERPVEAPATTVMTRSTMLRGRHSSANSVPARPRPGKMRRKASLCHDGCTGIPRIRTRVPQLRAQYPLGAQHACFDVSARSRSAMTRTLSRG